MRIVMGDALGAEAERSGVGVAGLKLKLRPVDGAAVEAWRRAGLEAAAAQSELFERFAEKDSGGFAGAARGILLLAAVDEAVEESAGGNDDCARADGAAVAQSDAAADAVGRLRSLVVGLRKRNLVPCCGLANES